MKIEIRVARGSARRWHLALRDALSDVEGVEAAWLRVVDPGEWLDGAVEALMTLERMVLFRGRPTLADPVEPEASATVPSGARADLVVDCSGGSGRDAVASDPRVLRPLYDGDPSEAALVAALLSGRMPDLAIEAVASRAVLARGTPSAEGARGLTGGLASVGSRVAFLCAQVAGRPEVLGSLGAVQGMPAKDADAVRRPGLARYLARRIARESARAIYHLCFYAPHWRVGWRWHDGPGVRERGDLGGAPWTVLRDPGTQFYADPFPVTWNGRTAIFFEHLDHRVGRGLISGIAFGPDGPVGDTFTVLDEPWHMSYPFTFAHDGALWMIPESSASGSVPLYRCIDFPRRWERVGTLVDEVEASDCTVVAHEGRLWMFGTVRPGVGGYSDALAIYYADRLLGPWRPHARRPVLVDVAAARPAGAMFRKGAALVRPVQDCTQGYGRAMAFARIDRLTPEDYDQSLVARITPGPGWPGGRLHTLNRAGPLECIDGTTYNPRLGILRPLAESRMQPRPDLADVGAQGVVAL